MKQIGVNKFENLGQALTITTTCGLVSYSLVLKAYYERDIELVVNAAVGIVGTCVLTYNTVALALGGDSSQDYTYA